MALKKSQLYSSLWQSCDELRGGMDASQYKDYVLTLLFMKYVSDKYAGSPDALIVVPEGGSFADMVRLKGDKEIGDRINTIIGRLAEANGLKASSTRPTSTTRAGSAPAGRCRTGCRSWWPFSRASTSAPTAPRGTTCSATLTST